MNKTELNRVDHASEYRIEQLTSNHYKLLRILFKEVFALSYTLEEITARFDTTNLGSPVIGYIAIHVATGQPAAYYGVFPLKILMDKKIVLAAQSGDTMTHIDHRKKGLFIQLSKLTYEKCQERGISVIYGSPNKSSYHGLVNRLNWQHTENINCYHLKVRIKTFPFPKLCLKNKRLFLLYLLFAKKILTKKVIHAPDSFTNSFSPQGLARVLRDKNYLNYKADKDKIFIKIEEVIFWIKLCDTIWIGEISNYSKITPVILRKLQRIAFWLGYNTIVMNLNDSIPLTGTLQQFKLYSQDAACYYMPAGSTVMKMIWTGADFDTW